MGTSLRPRSHPQRLTAIDAVRAHLAGPAPDPEVLEAFDKYLSGSLPAYLAAYQETKPLWGKEGETRASARAGVGSLAAALRLVAGSILGADGRPDAALVRGMLDGRSVEATLRIALRKRVTAIASFVARLEGRTDLQIHPTALAQLKETVGPIAARVAAQEQAYQARTTAGRHLAEATLAFDRDYSRFVDRVVANAPTAVSGAVLVRFVNPPPRKRAAPKSTPATRGGSKSADKPAEPVVAPTPAGEPAPAPAPTPPPPASAPPTAAPPTLKMRAVAVPVPR